MSYRGYAIFLALLAPACVSRALGDATDGATTDDTTTAATTSPVTTIDPGPATTGKTTLDPPDDPPDDPTGDPPPEPVCPNGVVEAGEECDDGNFVDTDLCTTTCVAAFCGDGIVGPGEACDDGNDVEDDGCSTACALDTCGDGVVQGDEPCDTAGESPTCNANCTPATCGDGLLNVSAGEQCDDGGDSPACDADCTPAVCGDFTVNPATGETCDDGNLDLDDACVEDCQAASCGDGHVWAGVEECDDGVLDDNGHCVAGCVVNVCGDGLLWFGSETCDDGNNEDGDGCPSHCKLETVTVEVAGQDLTIVDSQYDGSLDSMTCLTLDVVPDIVVAKVSLALSVNHAWIGDLTVKLVSPTGTVVTALSRPGLDEPADDGFGCCGRGTNIDAAAPVTFVDGGAHDAEDLGEDLTSQEFVCQTDGKCIFAPNPGAGPGVAFADFVGAPAQGPWRVCVGDSNQGEEGLLVGATLAISFL